MSRLDYRKTESVFCAGIPITTFLTDDRQQILVSVSDLIDQLGMNVHVDDIECEEYVCYDIIGRQETHYCILHTEINHLLWMHDCTERNIDNLDEFRKFFAYEVISFWNRFAFSRASLSAREGLMVVDHKLQEYQDKLGLPPGRIYQLATSCLGYDRVPNRDTLTSEEFAFVAYSQLLYASMAAAEQVDGQSVGESMRLVEERIERPMKEIGFLTRGVTGI